MTTPAPGTAIDARADVGQVRFSALGTTALAMLTDPASAVVAEALLRADLSELDRVCSRFRADSEIRGLQRCAGTAVTVSPLLADILTTALRAAELTDGLVDPTVGTPMSAIGYDRDFDSLPPDGPSITPLPAPGCWRIRWDPSRRVILLPRGVSLDVGATAKAWAADRAARRIAQVAGCGVLVSLGGDLSVAGQAPHGGWRVRVGDDHTQPDADGGQGIAIVSGGLATSGTARRRWCRGGVTLHHILDPRTGVPATGGWRTVSVTAASCVDANIASTASVVLGAAAPAWLTRQGLPARLVADNGDVRTVAGWPAPEPLEVGKP